MCSLQAVLFVFLFSLFSYISAAQNDCPYWFCGDNQAIIRFPFRREERQPERCGYPGFDLSCSSTGETVLELPLSGVFFVRDISYVTQEILLYDPDNCLPKRLLDLDLSSSPFESVFYQNYTFLNCSSELKKSSLLSPISCLSTPNHSVLALSSRILGGTEGMLSSCRVIKSGLFPIPWQPQYGYRGPSDFGDDLRLSWQEPNCLECESQGGSCRFKSNTNLETGCFDVPLLGQSGNSNLPRGLALGLGIPVLMLTIVLVIFFCLRVTTRVQPPHRLSTPASAVLPQPAVVMMGLDRPTIESYPKVVLGESLRLPRPDDGTCSICLSEYLSKETLRCIPECHHCFHADCIDKWLRLNATCPVCRKTPPVAANS